MVVNARPGDSNYPDALWQYPEPQIQETINLNRQGLTEGDVIDPWINEYIGDGVRLEINAGVYQHDGTVQDIEHSNFEIVGTAPLGEVVWIVEDVDAAWDIHCTGGTGVIANISREGIAQDASIRATAASGAELIFKHYQLPDGMAEGSSAAGIRTPSTSSNPPHNEGTLRFLWCNIQYATDGGLDIDGPAPGQAVVVGGYYGHNNVINTSIGLPSTRMYQVGIQGAEGVPASGGLTAWRAFRVRAPGDDIVIDDCDIIQDMDTVCVRFREEATGGSGEMMNTRIENNGDTVAIIDEADAEATWDFSDIHLSGNRTTSHISLGSGSVVGSGADPAQRNSWMGDDFAEYTPTIPDSPVMDADGIGGVPAIRFDENGVFSTGRYDERLRQPFTYVFVAQHQSTGEPYQYPIYGLREEGEWAVVDLNREGMVNMWAGGDGLTEFEQDGNPHVYIAMFDGEDSILRVDNQEFTGNPGGNAQYGTVIGGDAESGRLMNGWIGHVEVYDRSLPADERDQLVAELMSEFDI